MLIFNNKHLKSINSLVVYPLYVSPP